MAKMNVLGKADQLCWYCKKAVYGCQWSKEFKPIKGWNAEKTSCTADGSIETYAIYNCPEFEPEDDVQMPIVDGKRATSIETCAVCMKPAECTHHLIFGSNRKKADEDNLTIRMCNWHHNLAVKRETRIHDNSMAESLSKMLGQAIWERDHIQEYNSLDEAREAFMERYGRSYL